MSVDWILYEKLLGNGSEKRSARDVAIEQASNVFVNGIVDDPAYQKDAVVNGKNTPIIASRISSIKCSIKVTPRTDIHIGDVVNCLGEHWIVVELYYDKIGIINGEMWLCNDVLRFQTNSTEIHERHCVIDDGTYSKRTNDTDVFVMNNTYKIYLSIDDETKRIFVDKRFALGDVYTSTGELILEVYKTIGIDAKSKNFGEGSHLMVMTMQRDVYNSSVDSLEQSICDILIDAENEDVSVPTHTGSCAIVGKETIRLGTSRKYIPVFYDSNGEEVGDIIPKWSVLAPESVTFSSDGGVCTLSVPIEEAIIGSEIVICVSDDKEAYGTCEKKVQVITIG